MTRFFSICAAVLVSGLAAEAYTNIVNDGTPQTVTNAVDFGGQDVIVGDTNPDNLMTIATGGVVSNANGYIGRAATADNNKVEVAGGAGWINNGDLYIGEQGSGNLLVIGDAEYQGFVGTLVSNVNGYVGANTGANSNSVTVVGNATWENSGTLDLTGGLSNQVTVSDGGLVVAGSLLVNGDNDFNLNDSGILLVNSTFDASTSGFNWNDGGYLAVSNGTLSGLSSSNGAAYLSDGRDVSVEDGVLDIGGLDLIVGNQGSGSFIRLASGATLESGRADIGAGADSSGNQAFLTGAGTEWRITDGQLNIGVGAGENNRLLVSSNAWVYVGGISSNEFDGGSSGGIALGSTNGATLSVDNQGTVDVVGHMQLGDTNGIRTATVTVGSNSTVAVGSINIGTNSVFNLNKTGTLSINNGFNYEENSSKLNWADGATLQVGGTLTKNSGLDGTGRTLNIFSSDGTWNVGGDMTLSGEDNTVLVSDGASLISDEAFVGTASNDINNTVSVTGNNSSWTINGALNVGQTNNSGNSVQIALGGRVEAGSLNIATNNSVDINSGGTLAMTGDFNLQNNPFLNWNSGGNLSVGGDLSGMETAAIVVGGVTNTAGILNGGRDLTLDGAGAQWTNGSDHLVVGYEASGSDLTLTNGAAASNADGFIGWGSSAAGNSITVESASRWDNSGDLYVGAYYSSGTNLANTTGGKNILNVESGGFVTAGGLTTNVPGMLVANGDLIVGNGAVTIDDTLYLGLGSNVGTNYIRSGGQVSAGDLLIADGSYLDLMTGGQFSIGDDFDFAEYTTNQFNWGADSILSVGGELKNAATRSLVKDGVTNDYAVLSDGRDIYLDGGSALWTVGGNLAVGIDGGDSRLWLLNGATLNSADTVIGWKTNNNQLLVRDGSTWSNTSDLTIGYEGSGNNLFIADDSAVQINGSVKIGTAGTSLNVIEIDGSNSTLNVGSDLDVGALGGSFENVLQLSGGAEVDVDGNLTLHSTNIIGIAGDSMLKVGGNMTVYSNSLIIGTSGTIELDGAAPEVSFVGGSTDNIGTGLVFNASGGTGAMQFSDGLFRVTESTSNQFAGFQSLELTDSALNGYGVLDAATFGDVEIAGGVISPDGDESIAVFFQDGVAYAPYGELTIDGTLDLMGGTLYTAEVAIVGGEMVSDKLMVNDPSGGALDLSMLDLGVYVPNSLADTNIVILEATAFSGDFASTNIEDRMLLFDSELVIQGNQAAIRTVANNNKFSSALTYAGTEGIRAGYNGMKNAVFARTKQLRRNLVSTAHSMPQEAYLMSLTNAPSGAQGPGDQNTIFDMHVWLQYFNGRGEFDPQGESYGFKINNSGMTIGADRLIGDAMTVGLNYTYARSDSRTTNEDFLDTETYWLGAYGEWVSDGGLYVDGLAAVGFSNYESVRVEDNYRGTAGYNGMDWGGYLDVGQYYYYKNLAVSPYIGLHILSVSSDAHTENEEQGSQIQVDEFTRNWVESALGLKARHRFDTRYGRFQTTGYAEWTHDFVQEDIYTTMSANNLAPVDMARISPDTDIINTGLGFSWICTDYLEVGVGYNGRFSERYEEHAGSLMLDIMF